VFAKRIAISISIQSHGKEGIRIELFTCLPFSSPFEFLRFFLLSAAVKDVPSALEKIFMDEISIAPGEEHKRKSREGYNEIIRRNRMEL
jgi:hypothetical protein